MNEQQGKPSATPVEQSIVIRAIANQVTKEDAAVKAPQSLRETDAAKQVGIVSQENMVAAETLIDRAAKLESIPDSSAAKKVIEAQKQGLFRRRTGIGF